MKKLKLVLIVVMALVAAVCQAQQKKINRELAHLPPAVRKAIRAKLGDAKLESVEKEIEGGEVIYDVEMTRDGKSRSFSVDANGVLLDEEVFLEELPSTVQRTIQTHSSGATLSEIDKSGDAEDVSYDVEIVRGGVTRNFTVAGDGALLEEQVFATELPAPVRQAVLKEAAGRALGKIDKSIDDGEIDYDVEVTNAEGARHFTVDGAGALIDREVALADLPAALQAAIKEKAGADAEVHQTFDDGEVSYDVEDSDDRTLSFDADGKLLSTEEDIQLNAAPAPVQEQIKTLATGGKTLGVTKTTEGDETYYDVELKTGGASKTVSLDPDGKILPEDQ